MLKQKRQYALKKSNILILLIYYWKCFLNIKCSCCYGLLVFIAKLFYIFHLFPCLLHQTSVVWLLSYITLSHNNDANKKQRRKNQIFTNILLICSSRVCVMTKVKGSMFDVGCVSLRCTFPCYLSEEIILSDFVG